MKDYTYKVYIPSGNPTALVDGIENDFEMRKKINDEIIEKYEDFVEQVGFISTDSSAPELMMAGGEFCGNATRSAIFSYLKGKLGNMSIKVSGVDTPLNGGIDENGDTWVEMPIINGNYDNSVTKLSNTSCIVKIKGITHLIMEVSGITKLYTKDELKTNSLEIIKKNWFRL